MPFRLATSKCPSCKHVLNLSRPLAQCDHCGGAWLSEAGFRERIHSMGENHKAVEQILFESAVFGINTETQEPNIPCPVCCGDLRKVILTGVTLDRCDRHHGIWFDREELATVLIASTPKKHHPDVVSPSSDEPTATAFAGLLEGLATLFR